MTSKLTREKVQWLHDAAEEAAAVGIKLTMNPNELLMFTSYALAAMDSEPVVYASEETLAYAAHGELLLRVLSQPAGDAIIPLYHHAQPAPERDQVRREHAEWSQATFGNVGPVGPLKHLSKEALEAAAEPGDLSEWADMQFLLWDAQRRAGITDEQITQAMIEKLAVNKQREWPEPKEGEPRFHIKEQPALVVPGRSIFENWWESQNGAPLDGWDSLRTTDGYCDDGIDGQFEAWNAAMLQAEPVTTANKLGNSPAIPEGYVIVPMRLTAENGAKGVLSGEFSETQFVNCPECFGDDECETCDGSGRIEITVPITWTTIKEIWAKGVGHFSAAPQEVKGD